MPKKVLIALPPAMLEQVDYIAQCEHRTRSDLIREALRRYLDNFRRSQPAHLHLAAPLERTNANPPANNGDTNGFYTNREPGPAAPVGVSTSTNAYNGPIVE